MLSSIVILRFKSFVEATLPLAPLTLLIGTNASGKSNAIEAIRFLSWLAQGRRLSEIMTAVQEADQLIRGSVENLTHAGAKSFSIGCQADIDEWSRFSIEIEVDRDGLRVVDERITQPGASVPLYSVTSRASSYSSEIHVQYNNFARGGTKPQIPCTDQQAIFTQLRNACAVWLRA